MAKLKTEQAKQFAGAYLRTMDPQLAGQAIGRTDGPALLADEVVSRQLEILRRATEGQPHREDVLRRLVKLAYGRVNDCVRLVLEEKPDVEHLELDLLSEIKRNEKGTVEIKLVNRLAVLEQLAALCEREEDGSAAFLRAIGAAEDGH